MSRCPHRLNSIAVKISDYINNAHVMIDKACVCGSRDECVRHDCEVRYQRSPEVLMSRAVVALFLFASTLLAQTVDPALLRHFSYHHKLPPPPPETAPH